MVTLSILTWLVHSKFAGTVPFKLLLQLTTVFRNGLRDRSGTFCYKDHLHKSNVPILAVAGDQDLICPPEAVYGMPYSEDSAFLKKWKYFLLRLSRHVDHLNIHLMEDGRCADSLLCTFIVVHFHQITSIMDRMDI